MEMTLHMWHWFRYKFEQVKWAPSFTAFRRGT